MRKEQSVLQQEMRALHAELAAIRSAATDAVSSATATERESRLSPTTSNVELLSTPLPGASSSEIRPASPAVRQVPRDERGEQRQLPGGAKPLHFGTA